MNKLKIYFSAVFVLLLCSLTKLKGQNEHRSLIREGVNLFSDSSFVDAEISFRRAQQELGTDTAAFNIATSLHAQERYEEATAELDKIIQKSTDKALKSVAYFNKGNALLRQEKTEEALEAYKNALRNNPNDQEARYNYLMVKRLLEQQQQQEEQNKDKDKDQDKDNDQDSEKDKDQDSEKGNDQDSEKDKGEDSDKGEDQEEEKDKGDQEEDDSNKEDEDTEDQNEDDKEDENNQSEPENPGKEGELSREDALRLLEALEDAEEKTQEKVKAKKIKGGVRTNEKDW